MAKVADFIQENMPVFKVFVKIGKVAPSVMNDYTLYAFYQTLSSLPKMERYTFTAESLKTSERTVRNAVKEMERVL